MVDLLKLAVARRVGTRGKETLGAVLTAMAKTNTEVGLFCSVIRKILAVCPRSTNPIITHSVIRVQCELCTFGNGAHQLPTPTNTFTVYLVLLLCITISPSAYIPAPTDVTLNSLLQSLHALQALMILKILSKRINNLVFYNVPFTGDTEIELNEHFYSMG